MRLFNAFRAAIAAACVFAMAVAPAAQAADNYTVTVGSGKTMRCVDITSVCYITHTEAKADGTVINPATSDLQTTINTSLTTLHNDVAALTGSKAAGTAAASSALVGGVYSSSAPTLTNGQQAGLQLDAAGNTFINCAVGCSGASAFAGTATITVTRPADTTAYAVNDTWADSTSAPTSGGFTFSNVCSASGKTSLLTTLVITSTNDPVTTLQGEIWLFNTSVTAVNDNAAFALSDADANKLVTKIPFALESSTAGSGTNSIFVATGLDTRVTCSGSANLRALVKVKNIYTPASAEALQAALTFKGDN